MRADMVDTIGEWLAIEADHKQRGGIARQEFIKTVSQHIAKLAEQYPAEYDAAVERRIEAGIHTHDEDDTQTGERRCTP